MEPSAPPATSLPMSQADPGAAQLVAHLLTFLCVSLHPYKRESPGASSP